MKDSGVNVVAIGIGPHIDEEELVTISSDGNPYKLPNFGSLEHPSFRTSIYGVIHKIKSAICYCKYSNTCICQNSCEYLKCGIKRILKRYVPNGIRHWSREVCLGTMV